MELRQRLFEHFLQGVPLAPDASLPALAELSEGLSHADIQAVCVAANRFARRRTQDGQKTGFGGRRLPQGDRKNPSVEYSVLSQDRCNQGRVIDLHVKVEEFERTPIWGAITIGGNFSSLQQS